MYWYWARACYGNRTSLALSIYLYYYCLRHTVLLLRMIISELIAWQTYLKTWVYKQVMRLRLWIGVRVKKIGNASVIHEYIYYSTVMNIIVASGESVLVYLDKTSGQKKTIDESKKAAITAFESFN